MVDRETYRAPEAPVRIHAQDVPGALSGSRLFDQPKHRAEADAVLAFIAGPAPVVVEVGFDHGITLLANARAHPHTRWLGLEIRKRRAWAAQANATDNCLAKQGDARTWFAAVLPDASVDRVEVLFPTPSEKAHHMLWTAAFVADVARVLRPGGVLYVATDVPDLERLIGELLAAWTPCALPPPAPELSRRDRVCRRDGFRVARSAWTPA